MAKDKGGGSKKKGRQARKPSHQRYNVERRWELNKARKQAKIEKELARKQRRKERKQEVSIR